MPAKRDKDWNRQVRDVNGVGSLLATRLQTFLVRHHVGAHRSPSGHGQPAVEASRVGP